MRPRIWLDVHEEAALRALARHYKAQGTEDALGHAAAVLIGYGIDAMLGREFREREEPRPVVRLMYREMAEAGLRVRAAL